MTTPIVAKETEKYADLWSTIETYSQDAPGETNVPLFVAMAGERLQPKQTILDAGCGSGKGAVALSKLGLDLTVCLCDLTDAGLTDEARAMDRFRSSCLWKFSLPGWNWIYCCDVLEHIPPEYTMLTIQRMLDSADYSFFTISLVPDQFGIWVGERLHLTVQPFVWWRDRFRDLGTLIEARDLINYGAYLVGK